MQIWMKADVATGLANENTSLCLSYTTWHLILRSIWFWNFTVRPYFWIWNLRLIGLLNFYFVSLFFMWWQDIGFFIICTQTKIQLSVSLTLPDIVYCILFDFWNSTESLNFWIWNLRLIVLLNLYFISLFCT